MHRIKIPSGFGPSILSLENSGGKFYLIEVSDENEDAEYVIAKLRFREPELEIKVLMKNLDF